MTDEFKYISENFDDLTFFYIEKFDEKFYIHTLPKGYEIVCKDESLIENYQQLIKDSDFFDEFLNFTVDIGTIPPDRYIEFRVQRKDSKNKYPYANDKDYLILQDEWQMVNNQLQKLDKLDFDLKDFRVYLDKKAVQNFSVFQGIFEHLDCISSPFTGIEARNEKDNYSVKLEGESYLLLNELTNKKKSKKKDMELFFKFYKRQELKTLIMVYPEYKEMSEKLMEKMKNMFNIIIEEAKTKTDKYNSFPKSVKSWVDKLQSYKANEQDLGNKAWKTFIETKEIVYEDMGKIK